MIAPSLAAHPHVWIESFVTPVMDDAGMSALEVTWLFDDFNSADIRARFDGNLDGSLSREEQQLIEENAFARLAEIGYFLIVNVNDSRQEVPAATRFEAFIQDEQVGYRFQVPLNLSWAQVDGTVMAVFDESYYVSFFTSPGREQVTSSGRSVRLAQVPMQFATDGWGGVNAPAIEMQVSN